VILRVWSDRRRKIDGRWFRQLLHKTSAKKLGYIERAEHVGNDPAELSMPSPPKLPPRRGDTKQSSGADISSLAD
jgi:hypothetical protein